MTLASFADISVPVPLVVRPSAVAREPARFAAPKLAPTTAAVKGKRAPPKAVATQRSSSDEESDDGDNDADENMDSEHHDDDGEADIDDASHLLDVQMSEFFDYLGLIANRVHGCGRACSACTRLNMCISISIFHFS